METPASPHRKSIFSQIKNNPVWPGLMHLIFWGWNGLFALNSAVVILPYVLVPLFIMNITNKTAIPWEILAFSFMLVFEVALAIVAGVWIYKKRINFGGYKNTPRLLFNFFYGVEAPLFMLTLYRLFLVREMTPAMALLLGSIFIAIGLYAVHLFAPKPVTSKNNALIETIFLSFPVVVSLYISTILLFFAIPALYYFLQGVFSFEWLKIFINAPMSGFGIALLFLVSFGATASLFVIMPFAIIFIYLQGSILRLKQVLKILQPFQVALIIAGIIAIVTFSWFYTNNQPQVKVLAMLDGSMSTRHDREQLLKHETLIRKGLLNAYLGRYRYLSSTGSSNALTQWYAPILGNKSRSQYVQNVFNSIAAPFLYKGNSMEDDAVKAEKEYEQFFDTPIQKKESDIINNAMNMTWNRDEVKAGLLNRENKKVLLKTQSIHVEQHGQIGKMTIYEEYRNHGHDQQEVFYTFSLPEQSAVTGIWLGETADTLKRHSFSVSPRGAAQEIYNNQVVVERRDPALIELVGPNQYRLRAFPVPVYNTTTECDGELHLWLEISSIADKSGALALPRLIEKRNVFWDFRTRRTLPNGAIIVKNDWLPSRIKVSDNKCLPFTSTINDSITLTYSPANTDITNGQIFTGNTAVVIDASRSMNSNRKAINSAVDQLREKARAQGVAITFYSACDTISILEQSASVLCDQMIFFGQTSLPKIYSLFSKHPDYSKYSSLIILTDDGGYELTTDKETVSLSTIPVFIANISKSAANAYPDDLVEMVKRSHGGFAENFDELILRLRSVTYTKMHPEFVTFAGGYVINKTGTNSLPVQPEAAQLSAKNYIRYFTRNAEMAQISNLDYVHSIAKKYPVVTSYSSMIVLVNGRQRKLLDAAEKRDDRFNREIESGKENITSPLNALKISATPEPHEWMIIITIGVLIIGAIYIRCRRGNYRNY